MEARIDDVMAVPMKRTGSVPDGVVPCDGCTSCILPEVDLAGMSLFVCSDRSFV